LMRGRTLSVGESYAATSGVYGEDGQFVGAARSRTLLMRGRTLSVGESYAATSGVYGRMVNS